MLRDYQIEPVTKCHQLLLQHHICYINAEMRTGKTTMALTLGKMLDVKSMLFVTPKKVVLDKTVERDFEREGFDYKLKVINPDSLHKINEKYDVVVADESHCFLGETLVDGRRIDTYRVGDFVNSYNFSDRKIEKSKVVKVFKQKTKNVLMRLQIGDSHLICTLTHPFYVQNKGWVEAKNLLKGDICYEYSKMQDLWGTNHYQQQNLQNKCKGRESRGAMLFGRLLTDLASSSILNKTSKRVRSFMCYMWASVYRFWRKFSAQTKERKPHLFTGVSEKISLYFNDWKENKRVERKNIIKDDFAKSNEESRNSGKSIRYFKKIRAQTQSDGRQWQNTSCCIACYFKIGRWLFARISSVNTKRDKKNVSDSNILQNRYCGCRDKDSDRNRWHQSFFIKSEGERSQERYGLKSVRVESVEIYECRSNEGFVYNLHVEENENYFAGNILVHNCYGSFPKPAIRTKHLKRIVGDSYLILLSGTAHPESMSQLFHQFGLSDHSPFEEKNFYKWAHQYVNIKEKHIGALKVKDYSHAIEDKILAKCGHLFVKVSQKEAGFAIDEVQDTIVEVPVDPRVHRLVKDLVKDRIYTLKDGDVIVCDTPASLQGKIHQIYSGTVKGESETHILDTSKAKFIRQHYSDQKAVVFYKYIAEGEALKKEFEGEWTDSPQMFNSGEKRLFICQVQSGSTGINLSAADIIIFYNIDYSYVQYSQARARMQSLERSKEAKVHWLFAEGGIEHKIYQIVQKKKDYNIYYFRKDFINKVG